jgi:hypothetical protein|tara:strand:+ start:2844 stop:3206 length:363 start_codon:yes stop_codon:yes gene_type:complete
MTTEIFSEDEELFKSLCRIYKTLKCESCTEFEKELSSINALKAEAWTANKSLQGKIDRLEASIEQGWIEPDAKIWLKKWKEQQDGFRDQIRKIEFKERAVLGKYGRHMKHGKVEENEKVD